MKKAAITFLKIFMYTWLGLASLLVIIGTVGIVIGAPSLWEGFKELREIYSPFNIINYLLILLTFSPAIGVYVLIEYLRGEENEKRDESIT